jgi:hypothetical protein
MRRDGECSYEVWLKKQRSERAKILTVRDRVLKNGELSEWVVKSEASAEWPPDRLRRIIWFREDCHVC